MSTIALDESELPLLLVTYPESGTVADLERVWQEYRRVAEENPRVAYLIDMSRFDPVAGPADVRRRAGELYATHAPALEQSAVCEARVVSSQLVRGILVAYDWVKGDSRWPCRTFVKMDDARAWVREQLETGSSPHRELK